MNRSIALGWLLGVATLAQAQSDTPWNGTYLGVNVGDAASSGCSAWTPVGAAADAAITAGIATSHCGGGRGLGGLQFGEMFQSGRVVWGLGLDLEAAASSDRTLSVKYTGTALPTGNFAFSGRTSPRGYVIAGPRLGFAGDVWLPYVRAGGIVAIGSQDASLSFTPASEPKSVASFGGGRNFSTAGWVAGGGTEIGLNGAWSISLEFLHAKLGKGSDVAATCGGSASACALLGGLSFDNEHDGFSANLYRIGITHWFGYWQL
jgi:opacity protein-like surface antigen